jgi:hypothetical protein
MRDPLGVPGSIRVILARPMNGGAGDDHPSRLPKSATQVGYPSRPPKSAHESARASVRTSIGAPLAHISDRISTRAAIPLCNRGAPRKAEPHLDTLRQPIVARGSRPLCIDLKEKLRRGMLINRPRRWNGTPCSGSRRRQEPRPPPEFPAGISGVPR